MVCPEMCVTYITFAKCHGHYILCVWQLSGCNTNKLPHSCWKAVSMNCGCLFLGTMSPLVVARRAFSTLEQIQASWECISLLIELIKNNI